MGVRLALDPGAAPDEGPARWTCALVNNMPDAAFGATERQFVGLLDAGSGCETVVLTRHTMAGVPRGERIRARIAAEYRPLDDIISDPPDLLVVTGSNPIESRIEDEPYWSDLHGLLRWGSENVPAMVLSCLSAHAALAVFDGVERTTLPAKCTGVFAQEADPTHPLAAGFDGPVVLPHSRLNAVPVEAVAAAGYAVALQSEEVGWSVVTKTVGRSEVVLVQAHPEYDPSSLVREYGRDVRRYAATSATNCPASPGTAWPARTGTGSAGCTSGWWAASGTRPWWPPSPSTRSAPAPPGRGGARPCVCTPTCWAPSRRGYWAPSRRGAPEAMHDETIAIHGGYTPDGTRAVAVPIYQTVAHDFIDAAHAGAVLDLETPGFHYNRLNNPTLDVLEQRICALEGGTAALVVASGMAAVSYAILTVASAGSNFVVAPQLYGATFTYFAHVLPTLGIEARFAVDDRAESIAPLIDENTRAVFCETIGNPAGNIVDLEAVAAVAHAAGVPLIVDNTVATPLVLKPFEHGADVVVHSLTKFVGGHGTTLGGAIVDGGRFPWADHPDRFPMFNQPEPAFHGVVFARDFPERPFTVRARSTQLRNSGATLSPSTPSCSSRASRRWPCGSSATRPTPGPWPTTWPPTPGWPG